MSRQTLHVLLNQGKGILLNLAAVFRASGELESLSSLLEEVLPARSRSLVWKAKNARGRQVDGTFPRGQHPLVLIRKKTVTGNQAWLDQVDQNLMTTRALEHLDWGNAQTGTLRRVRPDRPFASNKTTTLRGNDRQKRHRRHSYRSHTVQILCRL